MFSNLLNNSVGYIAIAQEAAAPAAQPQMSLFDTLLLPLGLVMIVYLFFLRPQAKRAKEHTKLLSDLKPGDEVVTQSGFIGKIRSVADQFVTLELAQGVAVKVLKGSIQQYTKEILTPAAPKVAAPKVSEKPAP